MTMTTGHILAKTLRANFAIGTRTPRYRDGLDLHSQMIDAVRNAVQYPGYYSEDKTEILRAAWGAVLSYDKHVQGYRISGTAIARINALSPYRFAAFLGDMVDAGVTNTGEGERYLSEWKA